MRIIFDHQVFAFQKYGGISRYIVRLAEAFASNPSLEPKIVAPLHVNAYLADLEDQIVHGVAIAASSLNLKIARHASRLVGPSVIRWSRPDVVHETYYANEPSSPPGVPTVLMVHDMIHEKFAALYPAADRTRALKRAAVIRADHVFCNSESTWRDLIEFIPEAEAKASVTLLGFDAPTSGDGSFAKVDRPYLLYVGERARYKIFGGMVSAYASSPRLRGDFDVRCFGGGPMTLKERKKIAALGLEETSVRQVSGDDAGLSACYRDAAAFVYPSLYEGFGIPPLEAMSASCAVIAADRSSIPEICGDAAAYFAPDDTEAIRAQIEHVVYSPTYAATLIERGHERLKKFSWGRCADDTLAAYYRVIR